MNSALFILVVCAFAGASALTGPLVEGVLPCGSAGEMLALRVEDCTRVPCFFIPERSYQFEVDFIPSQSHPRMGINVEVVHKGEVYIILDVVLETPVNGGEPYMMEYNLPISGEFLGAMSVWVRLQNAGVVELCGMASAWVGEIIF